MRPRSRRNSRRFPTMLKLGTADTLRQVQRCGFSSRCGWALVAIAATCARRAVARAAPRRRPSSVGPGGKLVYAADERGNRIPDFSNCGYAGADRDIPDVPAVVSRRTRRRRRRRAHSSRDRSKSSRLPLARRWLPRRGRARARRIPNRRPTARSRPPASCCAVPEQAQGGTTLVATGPDRRTLVRIVGADDRELRAEADRVSSTTTCPSVHGKLRLDSTARSASRRHDPRHAAQHGRVDQGDRRRCVRRRLAARLARPPLGPHHHRHRRQHDHARRPDHHGDRQALRRRRPSRPTNGPAGSKTSASKTCGWYRSRRPTIRATKTTPGIGVTIENARKRLGPPRRVSPTSPAERSRSGNRPSG